MATERMTGNIRIVRSSQIQSNNQISGAMLRALNDQKLSLGALGLFRLVDSLPEDTEFSLEDLQAQSPKDKPKDVASYYQELIDRGYIE